MKEWSTIIAKVIYYNYKGIEDQRSNFSSGALSNKDELRDNFTAPELSRSTLGDQIDYDLDNFKINESSMDSSYISNNKPNSSTLMDNKMI